MGTDVVTEKSEASKHKADTTHDCGWKLVIISQILKETEVTVLVPE